MKITDIEAIVPVEARGPQDWRGWFAQILVMVETEDGQRGYGMGGGGEAGVHVVNTALRHELLGADGSAVGCVNRCGARAATCLAYCASDGSGCWNARFGCGLPR